ncbi:MAG: hypothetical protein RIS47_1963 [Bacteroidota bacterium]
MPESNPTKEIYQKPVAEIIALDNEVALVMNSPAPDLNSSPTDEGGDEFS